ncbi:MAG: hypothetical protein K1X55_03455 [Chitinophagales bacterium]|nr:hypothetical protein [Chitinophagales bacterium]
MKYLVLLLAVLLFSCKNEETEDNCSSEYVYFKVSEITDVKFHKDSYVLPILKSDTMNLRIAREIIKYGSAYPELIVTGKIAKGVSPCSLLNKDIITGKNHPWYVESFYGFSGITIEVCDAWPGYLDEHLNQWMAELDGAICFWHYSVTEEIAP